MKKRMVWLVLAGWLLAGLPVAAAPAGIDAVSAVVLEVSGKRVMYEKDAYTPHAMASTTKLMTALVAVESGDLDRVVTATDEAVRVEGTSLGLKAGDTISMGDLIAGLILSSGNDAANVIAFSVAGSLEAFASLMNAKAAAIGMTRSLFVTPSGLDAEGHAASAYDMALLAAQVLAVPALAEICASKSMRITVGNPIRTVTISNHNRLLSLYPDAIGMKTGYTKKAGRCLVSAARRDGVTLVAVTLNDGDDWNDHMAMLEDGFARLESVSTALPALPALPVAGGTTAAAALTLGDAADPVWVREVGGDDARIYIELPRHLLAPVTAGEQVGVVRIFTDGEERWRYPITAAVSISARPVATFRQRYVRMLAAMLQILIC